MTVVRQKNIIANALCCCELMFIAIWSSEKNVPDLEIETRRSPLFQIERLNIAIISVLVDLSDDKGTFSFIEKP